MIGRAGKNWQPLLADLALILFIVAASALEKDRDEAETQADQIALDTGSLAIWQASADGLPLTDWLDMQQVDNRTQLALTITYTPDAQNAAWQRARHLLEQTQAAGRNARVVLQPSTQNAIHARLHYDGTQLAETSPD